MILLIGILIFISVYFSARFFLLSRNIKEARANLKEITEYIDQNRRLTLASPNKNMEELLKDINEYIDKSQKEQVKSLHREKEIRKEIENISHDLRTPLTSILGYLELMKDEDTTEKEKEEYILIIERKSKGLQNLIHDFYDLSRLEANEYKLDMKELDIHKELMEQLLIFYNDFDKRGINVELSLGEKPIFIEGDSKSIERIFVNLIQNAIKYSVSEFRVLLEKDDTSVNIVFSNDVVDLTEDNIENLFNRFYMKDNSRNNQSSGLGLTITKLLMEAMGGKITTYIIDDRIYFKLVFKN